MLIDKNYEEKLLNVCVSACTNEYVINGTESDLENFWINFFDAKWISFVLMNFDDQASSKLKKNLQWLQNGKKSFTLKIHPHKHTHTRTSHSQADR